MIVALLVSPCPCVALPAELVYYIFIHPEIQNFYASISYINLHSASADKSAAKYSGMSAI